jgi:hypothetical protein
MIEEEEFMAVMEVWIQLLRRKVGKIGFEEEEGMGVRDAIFYFVH